jgi:hypothetical protein
MLNSEEVWDSIEVQEQYVLGGTAGKSQLVYPIL